MNFNITLRRKKINLFSTSISMIPTGHPLWCHIVLFTMLVFFGQTSSMQGQASGFYEAYASLDFGAGGEERDYDREDTEMDTYESRVTDDVDLGVENTNEAVDHTSDLRDAEDQSALAVSKMGSDFLPFLTKSKKLGKVLPSWNTITFLYTSAGPVENQSTGMTYPTIQEAIDAANAGNVIVVSSGTYTENVIINKPVSLIGPNALISAVTGTRVPEARLLGRINIGASEDISISGFEFFEVPNTNQWTIYIQGNSNGFTFENNRFIDVEKDAIRSGITSSTADIKVSGNLIQGMQNSLASGIFLGGINGISEITGNKIDLIYNGSPTGYSGIQTPSASGLSISGNEISNTTNQGLQLAGVCGNVTIENNKISNTNASQGTDVGAIRLYGADFNGPITIRYNSLTTSFNGIAIKDGENISGKSITIEENDLSGNSNFSIYNGAASGLLSTTCNWFASSNATDVGNAISQNVTAIPFLTNGTDNDVSISGFQPVPGSCDGAGVVEVYEGTSPNIRSTHFTIQAAVDAALAGDRIEVAAGTYNESVSVTKDNIAINGPNAGISPNTGSRVAEAIIKPVPSDNFGIYAEGAGFILDGIAVEGNNLASEVGINIYTEIGAGGHTIRNNIVKNIGGTFGILGWTPNTTTNAASSNNLITENLVEGIPFPGRAITTYGNFYSDITNNVIRNVSIGLYSEDARLPIASGTVKWKGNDISTTRAGIWYHLQGESATSAIIEDNRITVEDNSSGTRWYGMWITFLGQRAGDINPIIKNNVITGGVATQTTSGYHLWNNLITATYPEGIVIQGGSVSDVDYGIYVNNWEGSNTGGSNGKSAKFTADGVVINNASVAGVYLHDNPSSTNNSFIDGTIVNSSISNCAVGILLAGDDVTAQANDNSIANSTTAAINNTALSTMDATCNWYGTAVYNNVGAAINGPVQFIPYLTDGTDDLTMTPGFQPAAGVCSGTPVVITSAFPTDAICGVSGSIDVEFTGGTGPYDIAWTGGSASGVSSTFTIANLSAGSYDITVADAFASSDVISALALNYLSVTLNPGIGATHYATIQEAYDAAAAAGDIIEICSGVYELENGGVNINKSLTLQGQGRNNTTIEISSSWFDNSNSKQAFNLNAIAGAVSVQDIHFKVIGKGQGTILRFFGNDKVILNNKFSGEYEFGDAEVTRATEWAVDVSTGIVFSNNIVEFLRQPGYINRGSGIISNNEISMTRGWLVADIFTGALAINNNGFGSNSSHITILDGANLSAFTVKNNDLSGAVSDWAIDNRTSQAFDATCNWWGTIDPVMLASGFSGPSIASPFLTNGADDMPGSTGFQAIAGSCNGLFPLLNVSTGLYYASIQQAIDAASANQILEIQPTDYTEPGQVVLDKNLTLQGRGSTLTTLRSNYNSASSGHGNDLSTWMRTEPGSEVVIKDMTIDATGKDTYTGIRFKDGGSVENVVIREIKHSASPYVGIAVQVQNGDVDILNCHFSEIGRIGVHYRNGVIAAASIGGLYDGNTYLGKGEGDFLDYALDISGGCTVTVSNSAISNNKGVASTDGSTSGGILASTYFPAKQNLANDVSIINNDLENNSVAVAVGFDSNDASVVSINNNNFNGNAYGVVSTSPLVDATLNWWGAASGPSGEGFGIGDVVSKNVIFCPWLNGAFDAMPSPGVAVTGIQNTATGSYYCSIQGAIDDATTMGGHTISVAAGTYPESLTINKSITLLGSNSAKSPNTETRNAETILSPVNGVAISGTATDITVNISGFTVDMVNSPNAGNRFMNQTGKANTTWSFEHNIFKNAVYSSSGHWLINGSNPGLSFTLMDNYFTRNEVSNGISIWDANAFAIIVTDNVWEDNGYTAMNLNNARGLISGNTFRDTRSIDVNEVDYYFGNYQSGLLLAGPSFNLDISGNIFENVHYGVIMYANVDGSIEVFDNRFDGTIIYSVRASNSQLGGGDLDEVSLFNNAFLNFAGTGVELSNVRADNAQLQATCNWYGTEDPLAINSLISGPVDFLPYLVLDNTFGTVEPSWSTDKYSCIGLGPVVVYDKDPSTPGPTSTISSHMTIQAAIDATTTLDGHFVAASSGNYDELVTIHKEITLSGFGSATTLLEKSTAAANANYITIVASNVSIKDLAIVGLAGGSTSRGIHIDGTRSGISLVNVISKQHQYGVHVNTLAEVTNLSLVNTQLNINGNGLQIDAEAKVDGLSIAGGEMNGNLFGLSAAATSTGYINSDDLQNVSITGSTFNNNTYFGLLFNKGKDVNLDGLTVSGNGDVAGAPGSGIYFTWREGTYSGITIQNSIITNNGINAEATDGGGLLVRPRTNAMVEGIVIANNVITGNGFAGNGSAGIRVLKNDNDAGSDPGIMINNNSINANANFDIVSTTAGEINANCNWWGASVCPADIISDNADFYPFLTNGTDNDNVTLGFQPLPGACNGYLPSPLLALNGSPFASGEIFELCFDEAVSISFAGFFNNEGILPLTIDYGVFVNDSEIPDASLSQNNVEIGSLGQVLFSDLLPPGGYEVVITSLEDPNGCVPLDLSIYNVFINVNEAVEVVISVDGSNSLPQTLGGGSTTICANEPFAMTLHAINQGRGPMTFLYNVYEDDINGTPDLGNPFTASNVSEGGTIYSAGAGTLVAGTYFIEPVSIIDADGCQVQPVVMSAGYYDHTLTVNPLPDASITAHFGVWDDTPGNVASTADAGIGASYVWSITNGAITAGLGTNTITYTSGSSGIVGLSVVITNGNNCVGNASATVKIFERCEVVDFSAAIELSTMSGVGLWNVDRFAPNGFEAQVTAPDGRMNTLKHAIVAASGQTNGFVNTQGRKYLVHPDTRETQVELYVPADWALTGKRMAGLWGLGMNVSDAITAYPIIEFTSDGGTPRFRGWENGIWTDMGLPASFTYGQWVTLKIRLLPDGEFRYTVGATEGDLSLTTSVYSTLGTVSLDNIFLQGHNTEVGVTYDIFWDNLVSNPLDYSLLANGNPVLHYRELEVCENEEVTFTVSGSNNAAAYILSFAGNVIASGTVSDNGYSLTMGLTDAGGYELLVSDVEGCISTTVFDVVVNPEPDVFFTIDGSPLMPFDELEYCVYQSPVLLSLVNEQDGQTAKGTPPFNFTITINEESKTFLNVAYGDNFNLLSFLPQTDGQPMPGSYAIQVTSFADDKGCVLSSGALDFYKFTVIIHPEPETTPVSEVIACSGVPYSINFDNYLINGGTEAKQVQSVTYNWEITNIQPLLLGSSLGAVIGDSGIGDVTNTVSNPYSIAETVEYTVTPVSENACYGDPFIVNVVVNLNPKVDYNLNGDEGLCQGEVRYLLGFKVPDASYTFLWEFVNPGEVGNATIENANTKNPKITAQTDNENNLIIQFTATNNSTGCSDAIKFTLPVSAVPTFEQGEPMDLQVCEDNIAGDLLGTLDLTQAITSFTQNTATVTFHTSASDAQAGTGVLPLPTSYTATNGEVIHVRLENDGCFTIGDFVVTVKPIPNIVITPISVLCSNGDPIALSASPGGGAFSGPGVTGNEFDPALANGGSNMITYTVDVNGCGNADNIEIIVNSDPSIVTNTSDSGLGSLRAVMANPCVGDTIRFDPSLSSSTILLTTEEILVAGNKVIKGLAGANLTISGNNNSRIFKVDSGTTFKVQDVSIVNGYSETNGGGIFSAGTLILENVTFIGNKQGNVPNAFTKAAGSTLVIRKMVETKD